MSIDYDRLREAFMQVDVPFPWRVDARPSKHHPEVTKFQVVGLDDSVVVEMEAEGEYAEVVERDLNLIALAPDMARELLALRDEIERTRDRVAGELERIGPELRAARVTLYAEREHVLDFCNRLLEGDAK